MKAFDELTDQEIFDACANKSLAEIKAMTDEDYARQAIRYYFSRLLMNYPEETPLKVNIKVNNETIIIAFSQTPCEGYINIMLEGLPEWNDIDIFNVREQLQMLEDLLNTI